MYPIQYEDCFILDSLDRGYKICYIARRLHVTQPAVSQRLNKLENHFGVLAVRFGRTKRLTPRGKEIAAFARKILDTYRDLETAVNERPRELL